ncbi:MAG TPA: sugar ABC transporter permease [Firmicutes bacterium]|nr:sugar ABC transporter permease [Bacillota bacterium]
METELRSAAGDAAQGTAPQTGQAPEALSTVPGQTSPRNDLAKKKKSAMKRRETIFLVCILALPVLNWLIFWLSVNVSSFVLAFQDNAGNWSFINFTLFWNQLTSPYGDTVGMAILNTLKYFAVNLLLIFPLTLIMSYFIYKRVAGYRAFRVIFFLPAIISGIVLVSVYSNMISPTGPIGALLKAMGVQMPEEGYLLNPDTATPAILIYCIWTGFTTNLIIISSAMSRIPVEVLESARLDGCSSFKELIFLILPMIWPSVSTLVIFILTGIFNASGPILLFHPDGGYNTMTLSFWIYQQVYGGGTYGGTGNYGLVSCAGLIFTCIGVPFILLVRRLIEKIPAVEY